MRKVLIFFSSLPVIALLSLVIPFSYPKAPEFLPDPFLIPVRWTGSGSMHPTLPEGIAGETLGFAYPQKPITLVHGDIVTFETQATSSSLIKRIIAVPGDEIELRDGLVFLNGQIQKEPYIASTYSTYGHSFLADCKKITIPTGKYFVLGDNRKVSLDSREIGLVDQSEITTTIPNFLQLNNLDSGWHNSNLDSAPTSKPRINPNEYLNLINQARNAKSLKPLSISTSNTWQPITGTIEHNGYYTAAEIFDYQNQSPSFQKLVSNKDYEFLHIEETDIVTNDCPNHKITITLSGYIPPNYEEKFISGWAQVLSLLKEIAPSWTSATNTADGRRINEIISSRIKNLTPIVQKIKNQQWLTPEESAYLSEDIKLSSEQATLATKLNSE